MKIDVKSFGRFLIVGFLTVAIDAGAYFLLHAAFSLPTEWAKAASFAVGALFAYIANWRFTFGQRRGRFSEIAFVAIYLAALALNVAVNQLMIGMLSPLTWSLGIAFVVATGVSAIWNYFGMATFVFKSPPRRAEFDHDK